jgi:nucleoside-diphosphate-sugar epimerase
VESLTLQRAVVIGGGGFIGGALCRRLAADGTSVTAITRRPASLPPEIVVKSMGELGPTTDWSAILDGADVAIHLASRAHAPLPADRASWIAREVATASSLAQAARSAGTRLLLASSIKAMGSGGEIPYRADSIPTPDEPYGETKLKIERAARAILPETIVLRPPLVYGPGVKANFLALMKLVKRGLPLPLGGIDNRRSLVFIDNLLDLVEIALVHPAAPGGTFLIRDDEEVSTSELIRCIARALGQEARLIRIPLGIASEAARWLGMGDMARSLFGSLRVDDTATRTLLNWRPRWTLREGLAATAAWYREATAARPFDSRRRRAA